MHTIKILIRPYTTKEEHGYKCIVTSNLSASVSLSDFPSGILWYLLLLLPGVLLVPTDQLNIWRQDISFNLSGSITLPVSAIYFFNTIINKSDFKEIFYYMSLPIIAIFFDSHFISLITSRVTFFLVDIVSPYPLVSIIY